MNNGITRIARETISFVFFLHSAMGLHGETLLVGRAVGEDLVSFCKVDVELILRQQELVVIIYVGCVDFINY